MIDKLMLESGINELGLAISGAQIDMFDKFAQLLVETNENINLTSITDPVRILTEHFLDSITCLCVFTPPANKKILDVGTGAGFPGLPIAIMCPDLDCVLLDSTQKKLDFIDRVTKELGLENVTTCNMRAEDAGKNKNVRESFDIVYARAVSHMKVLSELCLPLVSPDGGIFIAQKSMEYDFELNVAKPLIGQLGGSLLKVETKQIPFTEISRALIVIEKIKKTPVGFPREYAKMKTKS